MKIRLPKTKIEDDLEWHAIFAFLPTITIDNELVWLEKIERRWQMYSSSDLSATIEYRTL